MTKSTKSHLRGLSTLLKNTLRVHELVARAMRGKCVRQRTERKSAVSRYPQLHTTTRANISHEKAEQIRARIVCTPAEKWVAGVDGANALTGRSKIFQFLADAAITDTSAAASLPKGVLSDRRKYRLPFSMSARIARLKYPIAGRKKPHCAVGLSLYLHSRFRCTAATIISQINHNNLSCAPQIYRFFYSTVRRNRSALRKNIFSAVSAENSFSTAAESFSISPIPVIPAGSDETPSKSQPVQILSASPISR